MIALQRAKKLRLEADHVMGLVRLHEIIGPYAKVFPVGSYLLDVMVYPDIDLYITKVSLSEIFEVGAKLAASELVFQMIFEKSDDPLHLPGGLYLKPRIKYGDWGRPWKIDIWSLDEEIIAQKMAEMDHFKCALTPKLREQIIRYKLTLLTSQNRTPMYSGYYIIKAFIDEGMVDFKDVTQYLVSCGIHIEV